MQIIAIILFIIFLYGVYYAVKEYVESLHATNPKTIRELYGKPIKKFKFPKQRKHITVRTSRKR